MMDLNWISSCDLPIEFLHVGGVVATPKEGSVNGRLHPQIELVNYGLHVVRVVVERGDQCLNLIGVAVVDLPTAVLP